MSTIYLIPSFLSENAVQTIPSYVLDAVKKCNCLFVENDRTTRRFLKAMDKSIVIDGFEWIIMSKEDDSYIATFKHLLKKNENIGIVSEAGCPGIADPGQNLVAIAHQQGANVVPLVGPSSILLALMASGMNGQNFSFVGYLPIDNSERGKKIKEIESLSAKNKCTYLFIETPYRNKAMLDALLQNCSPNTRLCIAMNITAADEFISTKTTAEWKIKKPELGKTPAIFIIDAS